MTLAVFVICEDAALSERLVADVDAMGATVVDSPGAAHVIVADCDATDVDSRIESAVGGRPVGVLGLVSADTGPGRDSLAEVALKPLHAGELALRLSRLNRRAAGRTQREALLEVAVETAADLVEITDAHHVYEYVNRAFERTLGHAPHEVLGSTAGQLLRSQLQGDAFFEGVRETLAAGKMWSGIVLAKAKDGRLIQLDSVMTPVRDENGRIAHHVTVRRDVTERAAAEAELRALNEVLEQTRDAALAASRSKSQFLGNMSHELRTPLNAIIGYCELLAENAEERADQDELKDLGHIRTAAARLLALVEDVLNLSKVESGQLGLDVAPGDLRSIVDEVVSTIQPLAFERGNEIAVAFELDYTDIHTDATKLRQLLLHLLSNANKFTERGPILVRVLPGSAPPGHAGEYFSIQVSDAGIGMTPEQAARVFEQFVQADSSTTRAHGGSGLGLALSRGYCRAMRGDIAVTSNLGEGSTFSVQLPRRLSRPSTRPPAS